MRAGRQWWSVSPVTQIQVTEEKVTEDNDKLGDTCHVRQMLEWKRTSSQANGLVSSNDEYGDESCGQRPTGTSSL